MAQPTTGPPPPQPTHIEFQPPMQYATYYGQPGHTKKRDAQLSINNWQCAAHNKARCAIRGNFDTIKSEGRQVDIHKQGIQEASLELKIQGGTDVPSIVLQLNLAGSNAAQNVSLQAVFLPFHSQGFTEQRGGPHMPPLQYGTNVGLVSTEQPDGSHHPFSFSASMYNVQFSRHTLQPPDRTTFGFPDKGCWRLAFSYN